VRDHVGPRLARPRDPGRLVLQQHAVRAVADLRDRLVEIPGRGREVALPLGQEPLRGRRDLRVGCPGLGLEQRDVAEHVGQLEPGQPGGHRALLPALELVEARELRRLHGAVVGRGQHEREGGPLEQRPALARVLVLGQPAGGLRAVAADHRDGGERAEPVEVLGILRGRLRPVDVLGEEVVPDPERQVHGRLGLLGQPHVDLREQALGGVEVAPGQGVVQLPAPVSRIVVEIAEQPGELLAVRSAGHEAEAVHDAFVEVR
jgi:hypothetical protein